jgi:hypothetical protein
MKEISHVGDMVRVHFRQTNPIFLSQINGGAKDMEDAIPRSSRRTVADPGCASKRRNERHGKNKLVALSDVDLIDAPDFAEQTHFLWKV